MTKKLAYSVKEAAEMLSLSEITIRRMIDSGDIKVKRTPGGGRIIIPAKELNKWVDVKEEI